MTNNNRLTLRVEGSEQNDNNVDLSVFTDKSRQFLKFLKISAKDSGEDHPAFHIVKISHIGPITMECELADQGGAEAPPSIICAGIQKNLDMTKNGQARDLSNPVLESLKKLAEFKKKNVSLLELTITDDAGSEKRYALDDVFKENLDAAESKEDSAISTVDGKLEQINIHNQANTFKIYTAAAAITCRFPEDILGNVQSALGKFVSVSGECLYRPDAVAPHKITVRTMEVLPSPEGLPSLTDLQGIAPDATQGKPSEQVVRGQRDEWAGGVQ